MNLISRDRQRAFFIIAALLVATVQLLVVTTLRDQGHFAKYPWFADEILAGRSHADRLADLSPAYLGMTIALRAASFGYEATRALQVAMLAVAALLCALAARRFVGNYAWIAFVAVAGSRGALLNATELEPETLVLFLNSLAIFFLVRREVSMYAAAAGGVSIGFAAVTRPTALLVLVALFALYLVVSRTPRIAIALLTAAAIPIVAVIAINWRVSKTLAIMDPGTVFYEGWNPLATGYAGVQPRIVNDLEAESGEPDALHVTYRIVASRDQRARLTRDASNDFWRSKAVSFIRDHPSNAIALGARKLFFVLHAHDAHDLVTMWRKERELRFFLPFSVPLLLAMLMFANSHMPREAKLTLALFLLSYAGAMVAFYVTVRQRNALIPAVAVAAAVGMKTFIELWPSRRRFVLVSLFLLVALIVLIVPNSHTREEFNGWRAQHQVRRLSSLEGDRATTTRALAMAATHDRDLARRVHPAMLAAAAEQRLRSATDPSDAFDAAYALIFAKRLRKADDVFALLDANGFEPHRETRGVSSVAYHRALIAAMEGERGRCLEFLARAREEAPGDADVLALAAWAGASGASAAAARYHDRFTLLMAEAELFFLLGDQASAESRITAILREMPEWPRARVLRTSSAQP